MQSSGFPNYNLRYYCKCGLVKIPASSEKFTDNLIMPIWVRVEDFER